MNDIKNSKAITASDMDKILLGAVKMVAKKDIDQVKKTYLNYIKMKFDDINEDVSYEMGDFIHKIKEKHSGDDIDFSFDELLNAMMDKVTDKLDKLFKELKVEISEL